MVGKCHFEDSRRRRDDGGSRSTTYVSPTEVMMTLTDNDLRRLDTLHFSVHNPAPGGGASEKLPFVVT